MAQLNKTMDPTQTTNQNNTSNPQVPPTPSQPTSTAPLSPTSPLSDLSQTSPAGPNPTATPPSNKSNKPLLFGAITIVVILAICAAIFISAKKIPAPTTQTIAPTNAIQQTPAVAVSPTQTTKQEIQSVDTGTSNSAEITQTQKNINNL